MKIGQKEYDCQQLQEIVGAQNYKHFSDFRKRVLLPAQREIGSSASVSFEWQVVQKILRTPKTIKLIPYQNKEVIAQRKKHQIEHPPLFVLSPVQA